MVQWKWVQLGTMWLQVRSLASLSGLKIWHYHELWCRLQMKFGYCIAMAVTQAGSCSSNWIHSLGNSICHRCSHKKKKKMYAPCFPDTCPRLDKLLHGKLVCWKTTQQWRWIKYSTCNDMEKFSKHNAEYNEQEKKRKRLYDFTPIHIKILQNNLSCWTSNWYGSMRWFLRC